jgi:hypothetical protein
MLWREPRTAPPSPAAPERGGVFPSPSLAELCECLDRVGRPARVLDLGPVQDATLNFFGRRGLEVRVAALEADPRGGLELPRLPDRSIHGILAWDFLVRVPLERRPALARTLAGWLAPGGGLLLVLPQRGGKPPWGYRFRVRDSGRLEYIAHPPLRNPAPPTARDVLAWFPDLEGAGARILRHGACEFLLRRPPEAPPS